MYFRKYLTNYRIQDKKGKNESLNTIMSYSYNNILKKIVIIHLRRYIYIYIYIYII